MRLDGEADVGEVTKKPLVDPGFEVPAEHVGIEHVPGRTFPDPRADAGLGVEQSLGGQCLDAFTQYGARDVEHGRQFRIARQTGAFRIAADNDVDPDRPGHFHLAEMTAARRNHDPVGPHGRSRGVMAGFAP